MSIARRKVGLHLGLRDRGRRLTDEEFANAFYDEPWRYELDGGRLSVMSPNRPAHDDISEPLRDQLVAYKLAHPGQIERLISEAWVTIRPGQQRIGDLAVFLHGPRSAIPRPDRAPELMFEIVSRGRRSRRRDYEQKRDEYTEIGVLEYVVIDPFRTQVTIFRRDGADTLTIVLTPADVYTTPLLPELAIPLSDLF